MNFEKKKFESSIPASFQDVFNTLKSFGFTTTLVGGVVRDFLLTGKVGHDWDLEISHGSHAFNKETWKDLGRDLSKTGKVSFLPYEIIRLDLKDIQYEFSPPRKESYIENWQASGHSNFTADFDFKYPFDLAVKRRDFTINAIGLRFLGPKDVELLDPLDGVLHLREKLLCPAGEDFQKDPVRFLRALRFSLKMGFDLSSELKSIMQSMYLGSLTPNYIWLEMQKSKDPVKFLKKIIEWSESKSELKLPVKASDLNHKWEELTRVLLDSSKHETWIIALEWIGVSSLEWQKFFSLGSETVNRLGRWAQSSKKFIDIKPEIFHGEFEVVRETSEFNLLFDWYFTTKQLLQKNPDLPLLKMIEEYLPDWIHLYRFEAVKDVKHIDPPLRAKYQVWNLCQRL